MSLPQVSVVMTTYNGERFLSEAIESILCQSFTSLELIVVDDGSTDSSASIIRSFYARDSRVRGIFLNRNVGIPKAANHGLRAAQGEYVARMDSDDLCHRDRLLKQISYLDKHRDIHILGCRYRAMDEAGSFCSNSYARRFRNPVSISFGKRRVAKKILHFLYPVLQATIVCRRSTLDSVGGYRECFPLGEDDDLYCRLVGLHGGVLNNLSDKLFYYRHYGTSITQRLSRPFCMLIITMIAFSSEFSRRGFWDPLEKLPLKNCKKLRFQGISSFLFLQDSLEFLPSSPRARLYHLLRVVIILRRFDLKKFYQVSLWNSWNWGITMDKKIDFYLSFCITCFRLRKYRAGFLYLRYVINLRHPVLFLSLAKLLFSGTSTKFNTSYYTASYLRFFRSLILTRKWYHGLRYFILAFSRSPFYAMKFLTDRFFSSFARIAFSFFQKIGI